MKRNVLDLRPTQFALGMLEVEERAQKLRDMSERDRQKYLEERLVPIVICRNGEAHIIDRHHLVRACWEAGIDKVKTETKADFSHLAEASFWDEMHRLKWTRLQDQFGKGPHAPDLLPIDIRGLADDLYRSVAWAAREAGAFEKKAEVAFCEFYWADFFRAKIKIARTQKGLEEAIETAIKLCSTSDASHLPGFLALKSKK